MIYLKKIKSFKIIEEMVFVYFNIMFEQFQIKLSRFLF